MQTTPESGQGKLFQWWVELLQKLSSPILQPIASKEEPSALEANSSTKEDAKKRLKLVLMHDRTQLSPSLLENMRDELVQVISKYVEIDQTALDLCLEQESNTIALVANISVVRAREAAT